MGCGEHWRLGLWIRSEGHWQCCWGQQGLQVGSKGYWGRGLGPEVRNEEMQGRRLHQSLGLLGDAGDVAQVNGTGMWVGAGGLRTMCQVLWGSVGLGEGSGG